MEVIAVSPPLLAFGNEDGISVLDDVFSQEDH